MLGLGLYIGEGAKTIEQIQISNSDPLIIALAVRWLKIAFDLSEDNLTIRVHIYPDNDEITAKKYWSQVTDLPLKNFRKTMIDQRVDKKAVHRNKLAHGTDRISVVSNGDPEKGVVLSRKLQGLMEAALNQV